MRVHDHVRHDSFAGEWQVLLSVRHTTSSFLTVSTGELVTNLRDLDRSHLDLHKATHFLVAGQNDLVDIALL